MNSISQKYLHDKFVLLLASANIFLSFLTIILIFLRLNIGQGGNGYIVEYRSNLGISAFKTGSVAEILSFVIFTLIILLVTVALSIRVYQVRRELALAILGSGILLLIFTAIVSNALTVLH